MVRSNLRVRDADSDDIETVLSFAADVLDCGGSGAVSPLVRLADGAIGHSMRDRYARLLADPEHRVVIAEQGRAKPLGVAVFSVDTISALLAVPVVYVSHVLVPGLERQRPVGQALVAAAATFAEEIDAEHVIVGVNPAGRETNRFFARLGFAPLIMRRIVSVPTLRRRLHETVDEDAAPRRPALPPRVSRSRLRRQGLA
ncbi:hypothetical protein BH20ACT5_BH20ACT5_01960 [soil metagenome]